MLSHPLRYPLPKLTLALIAGILIQDTLKMPWIIAIIGMIIFGVTIALFQQNYSIKAKFWGHWASLILVVSFGAWCVILNQNTLKSNHYSHTLAQKNKTPKTIVLQIKTILNPTIYNKRFYANMVQWDSTNISGKILLNIQKDSLQHPLQVDDYVVLLTTLKPIATPKNPHGFDYAQFLNRKGVMHQISIKPNELIVQKPSKKSLLGLSAVLKTKLESNIGLFPLNDTSKAFLKAFFLGNRSEIPEDIKADYKNAGVLHVLALSGLHVGILLLLFRLMLKPLLWIKNGKKLRSLIMVVMLWAFAILTGLSPSIVRAVSMFSCFAIAEGINRKTSSINTLSISAFVLLILFPNYIFDVGFQLSYGAVLGILILKPELDNFLKFKSKIIEFFNDILKVSIAAQIGILPLVIYYFHQFSVLFFLANLVVIPSLMILIWLGLIVLSLNLFGFQCAMLNHGFEIGLNLINQYIERMASLEIFIFKSITFDRFMMILSVALMVMIFTYSKQKTFKNLIHILITVIIFQGYYVFQYIINPKSEFVIFHQVKSTVLGFRSGRNLELHKSDTIDRSFVKDYSIGKGVSKIKTKPLQPLYSISNHTLLLIDSLGIFNLKSQKIDWVLMQHNPKIHFETMIETLQPKLIIADGSNYKSYVLRWKRSCQNFDVKFYSTATDGAFIYPLK